MGYNIELSINLLKQSSFSDVDDMIFYFKNNYNCQNVFTISETDGTSKIPRYSYVLMVSFAKDEFDNFLSFIQMVKLQKNLYIECIYHDDCCVKLLYASSYYLKTIDKEFVVKYKKPRSYSEEEIRVLDKVK
jgi:hypothetical protein